MPEVSAGILLFRRRDSGPEFLLVHPGGPFWAKKDGGAWSIPKGLCEPGEEPLAAAQREFAEETGAPAPSGPFVELGRFRQPSGKIVIAFAVEGDLDPDGLKSNVFAMEWPRGSGRNREFPEVDRAGWFGPAEAEARILKGQRPLIAAFFASAIYRTG